MTDHAPSYREELINMLAECSLFDHFSPNELSATAPYFRIEEIKAGDTLFREGDAGTYMGIIHSGKILVKKSDANNLNIDIALLGQNKTFGEMAVLDGERRSATCIARASGRLLVLSQDALERMTEESPKIGSRVIRAVAISLSRRLRYMDYRLANSLG